MRVKFWGVRGSTPTPQAENLRIGGNTPCLELRSDSGRLLIVDCGTGLRPLGKALMREFAGRPIRAHILLSHYHWDHIQGLPFFTPLYEPSNEFRFYSFHAPQTSLEHTLRGQMADPYFPVDMRSLVAIRTFAEINQAPLQLDDFTVCARRINHPQGCLSFRIESNRHSIVYASDNEPGEPQSDRSIRELARDADVLVYDSQFSREQLAGEKKGWGHSTWEEGVRICQEAGVKQLVLFHFDPDSDDRAVAQLEHQARARFPNSCAAYEGLEISL